MNQEEPAWVKASLPQDMPAAEAHAALAIARELEGRRVGASISPTDAARSMAKTAGETAPDAWRRHLAPVRRAAMHLARSGIIEILRKGKPVAPEEMRGVIRLRRAESQGGEAEESR
ncbi:MAG: DUF3253 domain-containing protein [Acidiphilium sp.]